MPGIIGTPNILQVAQEENQATVTKVKAIEASTLKKVISSLEVSSAERASPPTAAQCAVHLVLLESIVNLKSKVEQWGAPKALDSETSWQYYLSLASARFAIFTSSMRQKKSSSRNEVPPLDILIVWHAFMLNPGIYSRFGKTLHRMAWIDKGIDWSNLQKLLSTDNSLFILGKDSRMWLQDAGLHPDLLSFLESNESQPIVEQLRGKTTCATSQPASVAVKKLATAVDFLHRNDNIFNIDSFNFDLISAVNRQLKFATKMTCLAWRHSPFFHSTLISAINRYQHFFQMMKEHSQLAPTLDIDLVWHTHQLTPSAYWQYSRDVAGRFVNHNDMISEDRAGLSFRNTITASRGNDANRSESAGDGDGA
ncbi:MAG: hypothetical protein LQ351_008005 [Letrouitia transgressa]|nr:MAG: hypothetical protein LQ351_008005 [Letrouitia transgressa]